MVYTIGLDYGTNSIRCLIVDVTNGNELGTTVHEYETGEAGIILDPSDHNLARQNPADYLKGIEVTVKEVISKARKTNRDSDASQIIGLHDAFGLDSYSGKMANVMKQLLDIKDKANA